MRAVGNPDHAAVALAPFEIRAFWVVTKGLLKTLDLTRAGWSSVRFELDKLTIRSITGRVAVFIYERNVSFLGLRPGDKIKAIKTFFGVRIRGLHSVSEEWRGLDGEVVLSFGPQGDESQVHNTLEYLRMCVARQTRAP